MMAVSFFAGLITYYKYPYITKWVDVPNSIPHVNQVLYVKCKSTVVYAYAYGPNWYQSVSHIKVSGLLFRVVHNSSEYIGSNCSDVITSPQLHVGGRGFGGGLIVVSRRCVQDRKWA